MAGSAKTDFDVFISYSSADREAVVAIAEWLKEKGLRVFLDRWYLTPGQPWHSHLDLQLNRCAAVAICLGPGRLGGWQQREIGVALDRQVSEHEFPVIPVLLPGADDPALGFLKLNTWVDLRSGVGEHQPLGILARAILRQPPADHDDDLPAAAAAADPRSAICPYRGLLPFREEDAPYFCGREAFTRALINKVRAHSLVAVVGASGSGKSSVAHAGLLPALRRGVDGRIWEALTMEPGGQPLHALIRALLPPRENCNVAEELLHTNQAVQQLENGQLTVPDLVEAILRAQTGTQRLLLVVDQWEELYSQTKKEEDRKRFLELLFDGIAGAPLTVVLTLRADFYGRALEDRALADRLQDQTINLGPMQPEELRQAIVEPAKKVDLGFQAGLVDRILTDVGTEPGNLPLLEFLLGELWAKRNGSTLGHDVYEKVGGVKGAITTRADQELSHLDRRKQAVARRVMVRLVSPGEGREDTRAVVELADEDSETKEVVQHFVMARLLTTGQSEATARQTVEVCHEALIRAWATLRGWVAEDREMLRTIERVKAAKRAWEAETRDRDSRLLAPGRPLEEARELLTKEGALIDDIRAYIEASIAKDDARQAEEAARAAEEHRRKVEAAERLARSERAKRRVALAGGMVAVLLAAAAAWQAVESARSAREARAAEAKAIGAEALARDAEAAARVEAERAQLKESLLLVNRSRQETARGNAVNGMHLALRGLPTRFDPADRPIVGEAVGALVEAMHRQRELAVVRSEATPVSLARMAPAGERIATVAEDRVVRVWDRTLRHLIAEMGAPSGTIVAIDFSPDGRRLVGAGDDGKAWIWDAATGARIALLQADEEPFVAASFIAGGDRLATFSESGALRVWEAGSGRLLTTRSAIAGDMQPIAVSPDGSLALAASIEGKAQLWETMSDVVRAALDGHQARLTVAAFSPDGRLVLTADADGAARLWDTKTGAEAAKLSGHEDAIRAVAFAANGERVATGAMDGTARLWNLASGREITQLTGHAGPITRLGFSSDGRWLITGSGDNTARVWDSLTGLLKVELRGHRGALIGAEISPDGLRALTASQDGTARLWSLEPSLEQLLPAGEKPKIIAARFAMDGTRLLSGTADGLLQLWNPASRREIATLANWKTRIDSVDVDPSGKRALIGLGDRTARLWDLVAGREVATLKGHGDGLHGAIFSPDGRQALTLSDDWLARLWDLDGEAASLRLVFPHAHGVGAGAFSGDGTKIATAAWDRRVYLWDVRSGLRIATLTGHRDFVTAVAFSSDGTRVASASDDTTARLWDAAGREVNLLEGHTARVGAVAFTRDGSQVVTASDDGTVRLWSARDGSPGPILRGHGKGARGLAFSANGMRLAVACGDGGLWLWDLAATEQPVAVIHGGDAQLIATLISPDGQRLAGIAVDGTVRLWTVYGSVKALVREAVDRLPRPLSAEEERDFYLVGAR